MDAARVLLLGADGQLGWELRRALLPLGEVIGCARAQVDLADLDSLRALLERIRPTMIVNAAAYTAVDRAEREPQAAARINAEVPAVLAAHARTTGAWLVHYSTDYVFDGLCERPYDEACATAPRSVYGRSKRDGELAIAASGCAHLVFRTAWVYAARGSNFARTMLRLAQERDHLRVVSDQIGTPTSAELIADVTALALHRVRTSPAFAARAAGLYHLTASGSTSWHGYARLVLEHAHARGVALRCLPAQVEAIATSDYPLPAPRPANSRLDCTRLRETLGIALPPWDVQVHRMLDEILPPV